MFHLRLKSSSLGSRSSLVQCRESTVLRYLLSVPWRRLLKRRCYTIPRPECLDSDQLTHFPPIRVSCWKRGVKALQHLIQSRTIGLYCCRYCSEIISSFIGQPIPWRLRALEPLSGSPFSHELETSGECHSPSQRNGESHPPRCRDISQFLRDTSEKIGEFCAKLRQILVRTRRFGV